MLTLSGKSSSMIMTLGRTLAELGTIDCIDLYSTLLNTTLTLSELFLATPSARPSPGQTQRRYAKSIESQTGLSSSSQQSPDTTVRQTQKCYTKTNKSQTRLSSSSQRLPDTTLRQTRRHHAKSYVLYVTCCM